MLISLVGLPGVGKSTVGRKLAHRLGVAFVDCDSLVELRIGRTIADFFQAEGESSFRDREESVLQEVVATHSHGVVATGGGVVVRAGNRRLLREATICVYLECDWRSLVHRLQRSAKRPLLHVADPEARLQALAGERDPWYRETASIVIRAGRNVAATARDVEAALPVTHRSTLRQDEERR